MSYPSRASIRFRLTRAFRRCGFQCCGQMLRCLLGLWVSWFTQGGHDHKLLFGASSSDDALPMHSGAICEPVR